MFGSQENHQDTLVHSKEKVENRNRLRGYLGVG